MLPRCTDLGGSIPSRENGPLACKLGRPKLRDDQDRVLFIESAGTCLLCNTTLFPTDPKNSRSIPIAERAHIVAHSVHGARGDHPLDPALRNDPENIILLCPNCHTKVDKAPDSYPVEELLRWKHCRRRAVNLIGGTPLFVDRQEARCATELILMRNRLLFDNYGPSPEDGSVESTERADVWSARVLDEIVPNNRVLIALVEVNENLTDTADRESAEVLRQHTDDLESKHMKGQVLGPAKRFPSQAELIFGVDTE